MLGEVDGEGHGCRAQDGEWCVLFSFSNPLAFGRAWPAPNSIVRSLSTNGDPKPLTSHYLPAEQAKVRQATASTLHTTIMKIITSVNTYKEHIPPIIMQEGTNPFPYTITVNQRSEAGGMMRGFGAIF